jgi:hypothetical protein
LGTRRCRGRRIDGIVYVWTVADGAARVGTVSIAVVWIIGPQSEAKPKPGPETWPEEWSAEAAKAPEASAKASKSATKASESAANASKSSAKTSAVKRASASESSAPALSQRLVRRTRQSN